jgi:hypothetical protein
MVDAFGDYRLGEFARARMEMKDILTIESGLQLGLPENDSMRLAVSETYMMWAAESDRVKRMAMEAAGQLLHAKIS